MYIILGCFENWAPGRFYAPPGIGLVSKLLLLDSRWLLSCTMASYFSVDSVAAITCISEEVSRKR